MKVLLAHQPVDGGVGRHLCDLASGLSARGNEVMLCGPAPPVGLPGGFHHERIEMRRSVTRRDLSAVMRFVQIVHQTRPDIIHAHSSKAGAVARLARAFSLSIPVLYTPHGYAFNGHFSNAAERRAYRYAEQALSRLTARVVCVCEAEAQLARMIGPPGRVRVVHNGIEVGGSRLENADVEALNRRKGPLICAVTQLRPGKGVPTLIDAMSLVLARRPDATLMIVGGGPDLATLQAQAQHRGVGSSVRFLGESANPLPALRTADIFVHPSLAEAFPYVILEAMSVGLPTVATDVGGVSEAIVNNESGLLVPAGEVQPLATALLDLLDRSALRARMGAAARARVTDRFTRSAMIDGLTSVYAEVHAPTD